MNHRYWNWVGMLAFTLSACGQAPSGGGSLDGLDGLDPSIAELFDLDLEEGLDIEPNNSQAQAKELVPGSFQGQVDYQTDTDDFYYVDLEADQTLEVVITFPHREGDLDLMMVTANMDYLKISSSGTDVEYMAVTAPVAQRYFLVASGALFEATNSYRMGVKISEPGMGRCENDDDEPNDIQEEAKVIGWTANRWQWWNRTYCEGEQDWYSFALGLGDTLEVEVDFDHRRGNLEVDIFGPEGDLLVRGQPDMLVNDVAELDMARMPGTYAVRIHGQDARFMPYTLRSRVTDWDAAVIMPEPICGDIQGPGYSTTGIGDRWFKVEVQECSRWPEAMTLHARLSHQNLEDYDLIIYDTNNQVVATSKGMSNDILEVSHSSWTWNADHKTYLIHVKRQHNGEPVVPHQPWTLDLRGHEVDW